jgi:hypothetical protein
MTLSLGGPGPGCSAARMRRLAAGELEDADRVRLLEHVAGCTRCQQTQREIVEEGRALAAALPFEEFAAGVAEKLAASEPPAHRAGPLRRWMPLALAATLLAAGAVPLVSRLSAPLREEGTRVKGGAALSLYAQAAGGARLLAPGEPIPPGATLRLSLAPDRWKHAVVLLADADGTAVLYAGPAAVGPLPDAFQWTGSGAGTIAAVLGDAPLDAEALAARLAAGGVESLRARGVEVVTRDIVRRSGP